MRAPAWAGQTAMGDGWACFSGLAGDNATHTHHALQLVVAPAGEVALWITGAGEVSAPAVLIGADIAHRLHPGPVHLLFIDRESVVGRSVTRVCTAGFLPLSKNDRRVLLESWADPAVLRQRLLPLVEASLPAAQTSLSRDSGERVRRLIEALPHRPSLDGDLQRLAAEVALSPSRFSHRVKELVGMPVRPYLRWLRLRRALTLAANGASLTQAAQDAGFSDAAHLTRTVRRHFGVAPSDILDALRR